MHKSETFRLKINFQLKKPVRSEIRNFSFQIPLPFLYDLFSTAILEAFPQLKFSLFEVYWKDEGGDEAVINTDEDFNFAVRSIKSDVKTFYVRTELSKGHVRKCKNKGVKCGVICNNCKSNLLETEYKCDVCLCKSRKKDRPFSPRGSFFTDEDNAEIHGHCIRGKKKNRMEKRKPRHCWENDSRKKYHKGKFDACPHIQMINELLDYADNVCNKRPKKFIEMNFTCGVEPSSRVSCLRSLRSLLRELWDPSVREAEESKEEKKKEEEDGKEGKTSGPANSSASEDADEPQSHDKEMEEIIKILYKNKMSDKNGQDDEELEKNLEEPQASTSRAEIPETSQTQANAPEEENHNEGEENENSHPDSTPRVPSNPAVAAALEIMLSMGFTNEGNHLTSLLEAKNGDINEALEALSFEQKIIE